MRRRISALRLPRLKRSDSSQGVRSGLACLIFSMPGLAVASRLSEAYGAALALHMPLGLWQRCQEPREAQPFTELSALLASIWRRAEALVFIGATGIAVRACAPLLRHKSADPAVVAIDAHGRFVISLLCGHLGGANRLAERLAGLLGALPVISTASDGQCEALDLLLGQAPLRILDWRWLPALQARLLEGGKIRLWDPWRLVAPNSCFERVAYCALGAPAASVHWRRLSRAPGIMRVAAAVVHIGVGFRAGVGIFELESGLRAFLRSLDLGLESIAALATIEEKLPQAAAVAARLGIKAGAWSAGALAAICTPNPSSVCGARFGQKPFSVCEAAALASAAAAGKAVLIAPKMGMAKRMTFAAALAAPNGG